jgi:energy-coupling factor transport system substrate-specific component
VRSAALWHRARRANYAAETLRRRPQRSRTPARRLGVATARPWRRPASGALVALIPTAIAINIAVYLVGKYLAQSIHLPFFLGNIGTLLAGALGGPWAGGIAGALSNLIYGVAIHWPSIPYAVVPLAVGIFVGLVARWFDRPGPTLVAGVIIVFIGALLSAPIGVLVFGRLTGDGPHRLAGFFLMTGRSLRHSMSATKFLVDIVNSAVNCYIVFFIRRSLPQRLRAQLGVADAG